MTAARRKSSRSFSFFVAVAVAFALVPLAQSPAEAQVATQLLDVEVETDTNPLGEFHTLTATITDNTDNPVEIDFEIDCISGCAGAVYTKQGATGAPDSTGGPTFAPEAGVDADQTAGTSDDLRTTPDMSCTVTGGATSCQVSFTRTGSAGEDYVAGWVDIDNDNGTDNSDPTEGRDAATAPGNITEVDRTDVVSKTWFTAAAANIRLDCDDDDTVDTETNAPGVAELYTCFAYNNAATDAPADDTPVSGVLIDAENLAGANDPDNSAAAGTADFNNACTTAADGKCTFSLAASEFEVGVANVCFWIDEDNDTGFDLGGAEFDGSECDNAGVEWVGGYLTGTPTGDEYAPPAANSVVNKTDPVQKTWQAPAATNLDATPERDSNVKGTTHTVTATVTDQFGGFVANTLVDFTLEAGSANLALGLICDDVPTNASGVATCTYTDSTTIVGPEPEMDQIEACVDANGNDVCDVAATGDATTDEVSTNLSDQVEKFWFTTIPTAGKLVLDADANDGGCEGTDATAENTDTVAVETEHEVCVTAFSDAAGLTVLAGKEVTLTITGPGEFYEDSNDNDTLDVGEVVLGKTRTVTTAANGQARADVHSIEAGSSSIAATADAVTDTVTLVWTAGAARNIDCEPEEQGADPGTQAIVDCLVTDRYGNPTQDSDRSGTVTAADTVTFTEAGPGFIVGTNPAPVDTTGHAEVRVETGASETGTQTITGELAQDVGDVDGVADLDDPCDQAAGTTTAAEPGGAATGQADVPVGNCEDSVTVDWEVQPITECDDGIDNDFDGDIDFPADNGCVDQDDDNEGDEPITETDHDVNVSIDKFKKVKLGGGKKSLKVKGSVTSDFDPCFNQTFVKLQLRAGGEWVTRKSDVTSQDGKWKVLIRHIKGKYRAVVPKFSIFEGDNIDTCLRATDERRYGKKKNN